MTAEQLFANVLDVYALAATYRDTGRAVKYFMPVGYDVDRLSSAVEFRTAYARSDRLRFEERHLHHPSGLGSVRWIGFRQVSLREKPPGAGPGGR